MATTSTPIAPEKLRRLAKLPCNGEPRWTVNGQTGLTYSEAYEAIFKIERCVHAKEHDEWRHRGMVRILNLNCLYADIARDFILAKQEESKKALDSAMDEMVAMGKKVEEAQAEFDSIVLAVSLTPDLPPTEGQAKRLAELREFIARFAKKDKHECPPPTELPAS